MASIFPRTGLPTDVAPNAGVSQAGARAFDDAVPEEYAYRHKRPVLYIETEYESNEWEPSDLADWQEIVINQDGQDDSCRIVIAILDVENAYESTPKDLSHYMETFSGDRRVKVVAPWAEVGGDQVLFQGFPMLTTAAWQPNSHSIGVTAISEAQERMRAGAFTNVLGRHMRRTPHLPWETVNPDNIQVSAMPTIFNAGGRPNRTAGVFPFTGGFDLYLFTEDDAEDAEYWTYAQALRYLAWHHCKVIGEPVKVVQFLIDTEAIATADPSSPQIDPLLSRLVQYVPDVSVESLSMDQALQAIVGRAGLHYHYAIRQTDPLQYLLRVYATLGTSDEVDASADLAATSLMGIPVALPLNRTYPFDAEVGDYADASEAAEANQIQSASIIRDFRGSPDTIRRGGITEVEVAVLLRPGWIPTLYLDDLETPLDADELKAAEDYWASQFEPSEYLQNDDGTYSKLPRSIFHSLHPRHATAADPNVAPHEDFSEVVGYARDVFRTWVFPDSCRYITMLEGAPDSAYKRKEGKIQSHWSGDYYFPFEEETGLPIWLDQWRGASLRPEIAGDWIPRYRPFHDLIGRRSTAGSDQAPLVLVNFTDDNILDAINGLSSNLSLTNWREFTGAVTVDTRRAAIHFDEGNIWSGLPFLAEPGLGPISSPKAISRYLAGKFWVAIVATVQGDARLAERGGILWPYSRTRTKIIDYGLTRFQKRLRGEGMGTPLDWIDEFDPRFETRDDTESFQAQGNIDAKHCGVVTHAGDPESFYMDTKVRVGDSFTGVPSLGMQFDPYPSCQSIRHLNNSKAGGSFRTVFHMTDMRTAPEVNSE